MTTIPEFPFFQADGPEAVFGAILDRYLKVSKDEARVIMSALREETSMANLLFSQGHLGEEQKGMAGREYAVDATPDQVRASIGALLSSFGPSHEVKIATVAVALHRWFPRVAQEAAA